MRSGTLGPSGPPISRLGIGGWQAGGTGPWGAGPSADDRDVIAAIRRAVELGVTWVDTAASYGLGHSEEVVARALPAWRAGDEVLVFTKCGHPWQPPDRIRTDLSPASVRAECEGSLRRLGVQRIDLYQFHHPDPATPVEESWEAMAGLVQDGKVRWAGVSNFSVELLERCEAIRHIDSVQPEFSLLRRDAARDVIPWCLAHGTGVIVYSPLASGLLAGTRDRTALEAMSAEDRLFLSPDQVQQITGGLVRSPAGWGRARARCPLPGRWRRTECPGRSAGPGAPSTCRAGSPRQTSTSITPAWPRSAPSSGLAEIWAQVRPAARSPRKRTPALRRPEQMEWYRQVQFIAAVPTPEDAADELGTTVNGMWAAPEARPDGSVAKAHANGQRVLFSVPLIALVPAVYTAGPTRHLLDEVCRDIQGNPAVVPWYYWEPEPVYAVCMYSPVFRRYLLGRCREGIDRGMDVVNLDEINTNIGLMSQEAGAPGFCRYCLAGFRGHIREKCAGPEHATADEDAAVLEMDDDALRTVLHSDESLYRRYRRFHEREAFGVVESFITELRGYASHASPGFAVTANLAYLGNEVVTRGDLWGPRWGEYLDFVMLENIYRPEPGGPHLLLPRGKFTAWYRLGSAFSSHAPAWICPSIMVPRQLAGQSRTQYYLLMFLEAYANGGRWGYHWWPGVDAATRLKATVPARLKDYIRFISRYRRYYEQVPPANDLAILYLDSCISRKPEAHYKYLALAQVMAEAGYQFDVLYRGDGEHHDAPPDLGHLERYKALLIPEAGNLDDRHAAALTSYVRSYGGKVAVFSENPLGRSIARREGEQALFDFWKNYAQRARMRILASVQPFGSAPLRSSDPLVNVIRYGTADEQVLHLLNYNYDASADRVAASRDLRIVLPWEPGTEATCTLLRPDGEQRLECALDKGELALTIPDLDLYGLVIVAANHRVRHAPNGRSRCSSILPGSRSIPSPGSGLAAIVAAAVSGATFVSNQQAGAFMAMAVLTGVALLCYLASLLVAGPPAAIIAGGPGE